MNTLVVFRLLSHLLFFIEGEVFFESVESKTAEGHPVLNKISFSQNDSEDTWSMKQSHHGKEAKKWDTIKIVVDKTSKPFVASYHQLNDLGEEVEYRASCFRCHPSGPRAIRAKPGLNLMETLLVLKWNFKIKSYGGVGIKDNNPFKRTVPLVEDPKAEVLKVKACTSCHYVGGPRGQLTKVHSNTIKHLLKTKQMPPWPYKLSDKEKSEVKKFIYGF